MDTPFRSKTLLGPVLPDSCGPCKHVKSSHPWSILGFSQALGRRQTGPNKTFVEEEPPNLPSLSETQLGSPRIRANPQKMTFAGREAQPDSHLSPDPTPKQLL